jgi:hypothetical protein
VTRPLTFGDLLGENGRTRRFAELLVRRPVLFTVQPAAGKLATKCILFSNLAGGFCAPIQKANGVDVSGYHL